MTELIFTLFFTVTFCLGLYLVSRDGYLLDFLQLPFKWMDNEVEDLKLIRSIRNTLRPWERVQYVTYSVGSYIGTPLIMCITCMGSIWGCAVFVTIIGYQPEFIPLMIINCLSASFIQTFIWKLYDKFSV